MPKIAVVLDRLVREIARIDPDFTLRPETPERIEAAERCMGEPLPGGYREFLERIGRTKWPVTIGNVVDHRSNPQNGSPAVPARFVPFGRRADHAFDTVVFVRRQAGGTEPDVPIDWCERERGTLHSAGMGHGEALNPTPFADWLEAEMNQALAPPSTAPVVDEVVSDEVEQTRLLLEALIASGAIEVADNFDEDATARSLAPMYGDSERFHLELLDCPGIEEVYISEDDLEIRFEGPRSL